MTRPVSDARAGLLLLAAFAFSGWTGIAAGPDPHEILQSARAHLKNGDLRGAEWSVSRLADLIRRNPEWDPQDIYSDRFLPEIAGAVARIRTAQEGIAGFTEVRMAETVPPEVDPGSDLMTFYADWAAAEIGRFYEEWDRIIEAEGLTPGDRASLERSHGYQQTLRFLESSMLMKVAEAGRKELQRITGEIHRLHEENRAILDENDRLQAEIQRSDAIRTRLDSVKRSTLDLAMESEDRRSRLEECRERADGYLKVLADLIQEDPGDPSEDLPGGEQAIDKVFSRVLEKSIDSVRSGSARTGPDLQMTREKLDRYRHYNRVLTEGNLAADQAARIAMIETAMDWMPVDSTPPGPVRDEPPSEGEPLREKPYLEIFLGVLIVMTVLFGWIAIRRGF